MPKSLALHDNPASTPPPSVDELRVLKAATNMLGVGVLAVDALSDDQPILYANRAFEALTGYAANEFQGRNCRFLQGSGTDPSTVAEIRSAIEQGQSFRGKILNYRKDGSPFWNLLHIAPLHDRYGRITHFIGVQSDVTDQTESSRRLAEALGVEQVISSTSRLLSRRSEVSQRQHLDDVLAVIAGGLDLDRVALVEFTPQEAAPRITHVHTSDHLPPIPSPLERRFPWYISELRARRNVVVPSINALPREAKHERSYARRIGLKSHCSVPIIIGNAVLGSLSLSDFKTERDWPEHVLQRLELLSEIIGNTLARERGHDALVDSEALMRAMADALPVCISFVDKETRYRFNNSTYEQWFSVSRSELAGRSMERVLGTAAYRAVKKHVDRALAGVATHFEMEVPYAVAGTRHVEVDYVPHFDRKGSVLGFFALIQDVSDRRRADAEAHRLRDQLAHVSRVASMGELTATVAHELNQPLSAILSNAQAAQRELSRDEPRLDEILSALSDIVADDKRAGEVIRRIKAFLRPTEEHRERANLNVIVEEVIKLLRNEAGMRNVQVSAEYAESLPPVLVDRIQVQQILMNLLMNALDAVADAGPAKSVEVRTARCGRSAVTVSVHDNGPGIGPSHASRIFEPFFSTKAGRGLGMGLAISRAIAEAHGGELTVVESDRPGTTFQLTLPANEGDG
jgi:two-component system, LuxR family, sensor kinase FixL